ncbi:BrnA antitoxin family protein [beta proteobacterium MWH-UniP1]
MSRKPIKSYISKSGEARTLDQDWFNSADLYQANKLVRRGRPVGSGNKTPVTIRLDKEIVEQFKETGSGWQTRMNNALREWLKRHSPAKP